MTQLMLPSPPDSWIMESQHDAIARAYGDASAEIGSTDEAVLNARVLAWPAYPFIAADAHRLSTFLLACRASRKSWLHSAAGASSTPTFSSSLSTRYAPLLFLFTLVTGPRRSLSLQLSDTRVYELQIQARLGTTYYLPPSLDFPSPQELLPLCRSGEGTSRDMNTAAICTPAPTIGTNQGSRET